MNKVWITCDDVCGVTVVWNRLQLTDTWLIAAPVVVDAQVFLLAEGISEVCSRIHIGKAAANAGILAGIGTCKVGKLYTVGYAEVYLSQFEAIPNATPVG